MEAIEGLTQEQCEAVVKAISTVAEVIKEIVDAITEVIKRFVDVFTDLWNELLYSASNKKIVHLALHGRTKRIRKKNRNRLVKNFMKLLKYERMVEKYEDS
jgi:hypothetical protein